jgi:hypothetical protein
VAEEEVANQNAGLVAPQHPRRNLAAPHAGFIDDVVMQQSRRMHEFDASGEFQMTIALVIAHAGGGEHEHRAQTFAAC